jgi:hypothetical protein
MVWNIWIVAGSRQGIPHQYYIACAFAGILNRLSKAKNEWAGHRWYCRCHLEDLPAGPAALRLAEKEGKPGKDGGSDQDCGVTGIVAVTQRTGTGETAPHLCLPAPALHHTQDGVPQVQVQPRRRQYLQVLRTDTGVSRFDLVLYFCRDRPMADDRVG